RSVCGGARSSTCNPTSPRSRTPRLSTSCMRSSPGDSGPRFRSLGWCTPGASRCSISAALTSFTAADSSPPAEAPLHDADRLEQILVGEVAVHLGDLLGADGEHAGHRGHSGPANPDLHARDRMFVIDLSDVLDLERR